MFRCPSHRVHVAAWTDDEIDKSHTYQTVQCTACGYTHLVNPLTGRVLGSEDEGDGSARMMPPEKASRR